MSGQNYIAPVYPLATAIRDLFEVHGFVAKPVPCVPHWSKDSGHSWEITLEGFTGAQRDRFIYPLATNPTFAAHAEVRADNIVSDRIHITPLPDSKAKLRLDSMTVKALEHIDIGALARRAIKPDKELRLAMREQRRPLRGLRMLPRLHIALEAVGLHGKMDLHGSELRLMRPISTAQKDAAQLGGMIGEGVCLPVYPNGGEHQYVGIPPQYARPLLDALNGRITEQEGSAAARISAQRRSGAEVGATRA